MSTLASTSAVRLFGTRQSLPSLVLARRSLSSTPARRTPSRDEPGEATPARAHRTGTEASRGAGGPDLDPFSSEPRNSSTSSSVSARSGGAAALANLTQGLDASSVSSISHFNLPEMKKPGMEQEVQDTTTRFSYSTESLPLKTDPILEAFVNNLMKDGKKASATRHVIDMLQYLTKVLHANPLPAVQAAILAAGPLVRMQTRKAGGKNVAVPLPLTQEQGRRRGIMAIINASRKRNDQKLPVRLAKEIIAVLEGSSSTLAKKEEVHRLAMVNRSNTLRI